MKLTSIAETAVYTTNIDHARKFYGDVLGLKEKAFEPDYLVFYKIGETWLLIFNPLKTNRTNVVLGNGIPPHGCHGATHINMSVSPVDYPSWEERLLSHDVKIELKANWPQGKHSMFFRDPEGNLLELSTGDVVQELCEKR